MSGLAAAIKETIMTSEVTSTEETTEETEVLVTVRDDESLVAGHQKPLTATESMVATTVTPTTAAAIVQQEGGGKQIGIGMRRGLRAGLSI